MSASHLSALQKAGTVLEKAEQSQEHRDALKSVTAFLGTKDILAHKDKVQGQWWHMRECVRTILLELNLGALPSRT